MTTKRWQCVDAGSEYCPCYLAEENNCITCTQLQGQGFCDCNWKGVCIYNDFRFAENKRKDTRLPIEVPIISNTMIDDNIVLDLKVSKYMSRALKQPGSYIFVRSKFSDHYFDIPISIMDSNEETSIIKIVIEIIGIKTKKLLKVDDSLIIRGPYFSGIIGLEELKTTKNSNCLVLARGVAQAPAVLVIQHLLKNKNTVDIIVNKREHEHNFISEYFDKSNIKEIDLDSNNTAIFCEKLIKEGNYDLIFIGGSDKLQNRILSSIKSLGETKIAVTNNSSICCGEGICGACSKMDESGIWIKTCKAQKVN